MEGGIEMANPRRKVFLERLKQLLSSSSLNENIKREVRNRFVQWGEYYDNRFFNSAAVAVQYLIGRSQPDDELKSLVAPIIFEMSIALEDFAQRITKLQVNLLETGEYSLQDLDPLMNSMKMFQEVAEEAMEKYGGKSEKA